MPITSCGLVAAHLFAGPVEPDDPAGPVQDEHDRADRVENGVREVPFLFQDLFRFLPLGYVPGDPEERDDLVLVVPERHGMGLEPQLSAVEPGHLERQAAGLALEHLLRHLHEGVAVLGSYQRADGLAL